MDPKRARTIEELEAENVRLAEAKHASDAERDAERVARLASDAERDAADAARLAAEAKVAAITKTVTFHDYLCRRLPQPRVPPYSRASRSTGQTASVGFTHPTACVHWKAFDDDLTQFMLTQQQNPDRNLLESEFPVVVSHQQFDSEVDFRLYWGPQRDQVQRACVHAFKDPTYDEEHLIFGSNDPIQMKGKKFTDEYVNVTDPTTGIRKLGYIMEYKDLLVGVLSSIAPHLAYDRGKRAKGSDSTPQGDDKTAENVYSMIGQLFTYMSNLEDATHRVRYGIFSNYLCWCFCKVDSDNRLHCSNWYYHDTQGASSVSAAFAYFLTLVVEQGGIPVIVQSKTTTTTVITTTTTVTTAGSLSSGAVTPSSSTAVPSPAPPPPPGSSRFTIFERKSMLQKAAPANDPLLREDAFMFQPNSVVISNTPKAVTYRGTVEGLDLVWKHVDMYKTPKYTEWTREELINMMENEARVYKHLENVQGEIIPSLMYWGRDWAVWWVIVTTYEGISLDHLHSEGKLDMETRVKALESLQKLHQHGVIHGDAELRNAVRRERDGAVIWVDFERGRVLGDDCFKGNVEEFETQAKKEELRVAQMLELEVPSSMLRKRVVGPTTRNEIVLNHGVMKRTFVQSSTA